MWSLFDVGYLYVHLSVPFFSMGMIATDLGSPWLFCLTSKCAAAGTWLRQPIPDHARTLVTEKLRDHPHSRICVNNRSQEYRAIRAAYLPIGPQPITAVRAIKGV